MEKLKDDLKRVSKERNFALFTLFVVGEDVGGNIKQVVWKKMISKQHSKRGNPHYSPCLLWSPSVFDVIVCMTNKRSSTVNFKMFARHQQLQRDKSGEGREMREGGEPKHEVASYIEGQPQGGRRKPEWHADLVPGPLDLEG